MNFSILENNINKYSDIYLNNYSFNDLKVEIITSEYTIKEYKEILKSDSIFSNNNTLIKDINTLRYLYRFNIICKNITFKIHLLTYFDIKKTNYKEIQEIYLVTNIMYSLFYNNLNVNQTDIYFYLYNKPRTLNIGNSSVKSLITLNKLNHFNCPSGYTLLDKSKIVITRYNHYLSLFIHELIHYYNIDQTDNVICDNWDGIFLECFNNFNHGYFFEAIDNTKSCIINLLIKKYAKINKSLIKSDTKELYDLEYKYSLYLCLSLLKFLNYKSFKEMIKKDNKFNGSTFEYSFGKLILLMNPKLFTNDEYLTFNCNIDKFKEILKDFDLVYDNKEYNKLHNLFTRYIKDKYEIDYYFI